MNSELLFHFKQVYLEILKKDPKEDTARVTNGARKIAKY